MGLTDQDALLALGIAPVATNEWFGEQPGAIWPWAMDEFEALDAETPTIVGSQAGINFEAVAAEQPDLILALYADLTDEEHTQLSGIAPTVTAPEGLSSFGISWQDQTVIVGRAVGKKPRPRRWSTRSRPRSRVRRPRS